MLMCQRAVQKSVRLLGEAEGIDGLWRSLPSLDREGDSAAVVLYLPSRGPVAALALLLVASVALLFSVFTPLSLSFFFCHSSSPINVESAQGGLLHPQPTSAVMVSGALEDACSDVQQLPCSLSC